MGTIKIKIDAERKGDKLECEINWEGDREQILKTMSFIDELAADNNVKPQEFASSAILHLPTWGVLEEEGPRQVQMMAIIYAVLRTANEYGDLTTHSILDLVEHQDMVATLIVRDKTIKVELSGRPLLDS